MLASLTEAERTNLVSSLTDADAAALLYDWSFWARPKQLLPEGEWTTWLNLAGRGYGKTRVGSETVRGWARDFKLVNLVGATADDARDIMIEGESGILAVCPPCERPLYQVSKRQLAWPNGAKSLIFTADEPERLRGKQHDKLWCFIAGTTVATPSGSMPIETLAIGDEVSTSRGPRRILATGNRLASVGWVGFSNGEQLTGTAQHPVVTLHGATTLAMLKRGDLVCVGPKHQTATLQPMRAAARFTSIVMSGNRRMGRYQTATKSTTRTEIVRTTFWIIWNLFKRAFTRLSMGRRDRTLSLNAQFAEGRSFGKPIGALHLSVRAASIGEPMRGGRGQRPVFTVGPSLNPGEETTAVSVVSTWEPAGKQRVYNLTVDDAHEYYANGILVHNCDELAAWRYPEAWDQARLGLRLGANPQAIVTTTPRPTKIIKELLADPSTVVTRGTTYENRANLAPVFYSKVITKYEGTRLGRQELMAEILDDNPGALWKRSDIEERAVATCPELKRLVVAVDPAVSNSEDSDETGIVVAGIGFDNHGYVLDDMSLRGTPHQWGSQAVAAYSKYKADRLVAEVNNGGDMVELTVRTVDPNVSYRAVHASRGKVIRAEPIASLYEQGRVHHVGSFPLLEDQLCQWEPGQMKSPDRLDALVWALSDLMLDVVVESGVW